MEKLPEYATPEELAHYEGWLEQVHLELQPEYENWLREISERMN